MTIKTKKVKLDSLIIFRDDIEDFIKMKIISLGKAFLSKTYDISKIENIISLIKAAEEQLIEIKIALQKANTNGVHEDGRSNYYYIFKLSSLNREKITLKQILQRKDNIDFLNEKGIKSKQNNAPSKENLLKATKKIESRLSELETEIPNIQQKLSDFNEKTEVEVQIHEGFEKLIN